MDRFVKPAAREADWVQAPGSACQTPVKRKPGRPPESQEKKRLRREEKEKDQEEESKPTKRRNEKEEDLKTAIALLADEVFKSEDDPEKAERVKKIHELLSKDAMLKKAGDLRSAAAGKRQGPEGEKGRASGKLRGRNEDKGVCASGKRDRDRHYKKEGFVMREAHKTIPQKKSVYSAH